GIRKRRCLRTHIGPPFPSRFPGRVRCRGGSRLLRNPFRSTGFTAVLRRVDRVPRFPREGTKRHPAKPAMNVLRLLPRRRTPLLDVAIERLIFEPDSYWPDDSYFHRRNRQKLARAWNAMPELHDKGRDEIRDIFRHILIQRRSCRPTTLYVMSYGS